MIRVALILGLGLGLGLGRGLVHGATPDAAAGAPAGGFRPAAPGYRWSFPRDHFAHPGYRTEWWYLTGTLRSIEPPGRRFGYQLTFFRVGLLPERPPLGSAWAASDAVMAHLAVTDVTGGTHRFSEVLWRAMPLLGGFGAPPWRGGGAGGRPPASAATIAWAQAPPGTEGCWTLGLDPGGTFRLAAEDRARGIALHLAATPEMRPVLQGPGGLSRKAPDPAYASLYASIPRLETEGTLTADGQTWLVRGESWLDQEFGSSQLAPEQVGWDWFALRLADGRDLTLYVLRRADGSADWRNATIVDRRQGARSLSPEGWSVRATGRWKSPETGAAYPSGWEIAIPAEALRLRVTPEVASAENRSALADGLFYWEGPVRVSGEDGTDAGVGYVELTGYGKRSRPPL
jgi:predicted secreted hydrolase